MTSRPSFNPIRFAVLRLMTLTPAPVSTRKLRGFLDCGTLTSTHRRPLRNSNGNSASEIEAACTPARAAAKIRMAHRRPRTSEYNARYVPHIESGRDLSFRGDFEC